ncbi:4-aminobutyrate aminotransferase-like enzyme [Bradyrhizobium sp. IAR9]|nr:4-aminobutyrate aminotransferase-like enzyme [Bradyrhizobium sp. IAR9]
MLLLRGSDVLVAFTEYNRNVIRLEPPLIGTCDHIDNFIDALDSLLER